MKYIKILLALSAFYSLSTQAQHTHQAWADSMKSETYIGMELMLDEMVKHADHDSSSDKGYGFYKTNPLNSTDEVMSRLSGISMMRRGNYAWEPTINGLSSGQINLTIDGMRVFGACTDKMDPVSSYVEPNNLESIKIEQGCGGSEFGSTVGGAVAFDLKKPVFSQSISGHIGSRYESVANGLSNTASVNYGGQNLAVRVNGSIRNFQNYTDGNGDEVLYSGYEKKNLSLATAYRLTGNSLINIDFLVDDANDVGYPGLPMDVAFAKAKMGAVSYMLWPSSSPVKQLEIKGYANTVDHLMDDSQREGLTVRMDMPGETQTFGGFVKADMIMGNKHSLTAKTDWYSTTAYAEMTMFVAGAREMFMITWPDVERHDVGLYLDDQIRLSKRFTLNIDGRLEWASTEMQNELGRQQFSIFGYQDDEYQRTDFVVNSGGSLSYSISKSLMTTASLGYGQRLPSSSELYGFFLYNSNEGFDYLGNPRIKKESSLQSQLSLNYSKGNNFDLNLRGFNYWFYNYIFGQIDTNLDAMTIGSRGTKVYENIDGVTYKGFEIQSSLRPTNYLELLYNLKATYAEDENGNPLPLIPPLKNFLTLVLKNKGYTLRAEGEWSRRQTRNSELAGELETSGYFLLHTRLNKSFDIKKLQFDVALGVENLLDEDYRDHLDWGLMLRPGRNVYTSLNVNF